MLDVIEKIVHIAFELASTVGIVIALLKANKND